MLDRPQAVLPRSQLVAVRPELWLTVVLHCLQELLPVVLCLAMELQAL